MYAKKSEQLFSILCLFKTRNKIYQKDMKKLTGFSYANIVRSLQRIETDKIIKSTHEDSKKGKKGPGCDIWGLTHYGLMLLLEKTSPNDLEVIINTHKDRLLAFKKWPLFKQAEVDHDLLTILTCEVFVSVSRNFLLKREGYEISWGPEDEWAESMNCAIIMPLIKRNDSSAKMLRKVCKSDPDLKVFVEKHLTVELARKEEELKVLQSTNQAWIDLSVSAKFLEELQKRKEIEPKIFAVMSDRKPHTYEEIREKTGLSATEISNYFSYRKKEHEVSKA